MRCYVQVLNGEVGLLPYFVAHYKRLGATSFPVVTFGGPNDLRSVVQLIQRTGAEALPLGGFTSAQFNDKMRWRFIRQHCLPGRWAFFPDVDEFADLPEGLIRNNRCVVEAHERTGVIVGCWLDRVSPDHTFTPLPDYFAGDNLEDAYPLSCRVRGSLNLYDHVLIMSRGGPHGHHPQRQHFLSTPIYDAHHFRWSSTAASRIQFHIHWRTEWLRRMGWNKPKFSEGMQQTLDLIQARGRIPPEWTTPCGRVLNIPTPSSV